MSLRNVVLLCILAGALILPFGGPYWMAIAISICLNVSLASSVRLCLVGKLFNVATAAIMAVGAYTSALLVTKGGMPFEIGLLSAGLAGGVLSILIGYPALRLTSGLYFGMVTIAFVEVVRMIANMTQPLTGGPGGLKWIPRPSILGISLDSKAGVYYLALALTVLTLAVLYRLDNSRFGMIWRAIGQSENLARSVGINLPVYKTMAFMIASIFAALIGAFYAHYVTFISPASFAVMVSLYPLLYAWVGGQSRFAGPIVGAAFMTLLSEPFRGQGQYEMILHSTVLLLAVILLPGGLVTLPQKLSTLSRTRRRARFEAANLKEANETVSNVPQAP